MGFDDPIHNREPQSAISSGGVYSCRINPIEAVKQIGHMFWGNADPRITNGEQRLPLPGLERDKDLSPCVIVADRILQQVHDDLH